MKNFSIFRFFDWCLVLGAWCLVLGASFAFGGSLPIVQDGLVIHLDAKDASTMTEINDPSLSGFKRVQEWRSKVGGVKFVQQGAQTAAQLPYCQKQSRTDVPEWARKDGVVFGFAPNYAYKGTSTDYSKNILTKLQADTSVTSKEVLMVVVSLNNSTKSFPQYFNSVLYGTGASDDFVKWAGAASKDRDKVYGSYYYGTDGKAWVAGVQVFGGAAGTPEKFVLPYNELKIFDSVGHAASTHEGTPCLGDANLKKGSAMIVCELAAYDRELTDEERSYMLKLLTDKWVNNVSYPEWTGNGGDGKWETAANWDDNKVPSANATVIIDKPANVTISSKVNVASLKLGAEACLTVNAGAVFACGALDAAAGSMVTVNGLFDYNVAGGTTVAPSDMAVNGNGMIGKRGRGTLRLPAGVTLAPTLALRVDDGLFDMAGVDRAFRSVLGGATVTNSSATAATLEITNAVTCSLEAKVTGNVSLKKSGIGELSYAKLQDYAGETIIAGGAMQAVTNVAIQSIPGLEVHLDAMRNDTLTLGSDGAVLEWRSLTGDDLVYKPPREFTTHGDFAAGGKYGGNGHYEAAGIYGLLPCVRFGVETNGCLIAGGYRATTNRTVIVVQQNVVSGEDTLTAFGNYQSAADPTTGQDRGMIEYDGASECGYAHSVWNNKTNDIYCNARQVWNRKDYEKGTQAANWRWCGSPEEANRPIVLSVVVPDDNGWKQGSARLDAFQTCVGAGRVYHNGTGSGSGYRQYVGRVCEVLVFNRALTDDERREIETYLMVKWGDASYPPYEPGIRKFSNRPVSKTLTVDAGGGAALPRLNVLGDIDISDMTLKLQNVDDVLTPGTFLSTDKALTGEFGTIIGNKVTFEITYGPQSVSFYAHQGFMTIVW